MLRKTSSCLPQIALISAEIHLKSISAILRNLRETRFVRNIRYNDMVKKMKVLSIAIGGMIFLNSCIVKTKAPVDDGAYYQEIESWHQQRVENSLKGQQGWLNLVGLFWLKDGSNTFGSDQSNDLVFPDKMPGKAGVFILQNGEVRMQLTKGIQVECEGLSVSDKVLYYPDSTYFPIAIYGSIQYHVVKRADELGIRVRDLQSDAIVRFKGVDRYAVDTLWRLKAHFEPAGQSRKLEITNIVGQTYMQSSPGTLVFNIEGTTYKLDVLDEGGEDYFVIFGDNTNEEITYPSGRYMYVKKPDEAGNVVVDFNKAYNPPCAFTDYATCPLPPRQNILDVEITAGEKKYTLHE